MASPPRPPPHPFARLLTRLRPRLRPTLLALGTLATWYPLYAFANGHLAQLMWVSGRSMYPFLNSSYHTSTQKDVVFVDMRNPHQELRRGMVVCFWAPHRPEDLVVKRVVALEGDEVVTLPPYAWPREVVPKGHVWVEGEDPASRDSNSYGPVAVSLLVGRVRGIVWPLRKAAVVDWRDWRGNGRVVENRHDFSHVTMG